MSVSYSANFVYGVQLRDNDGEKQLKDMPDLLLAAVLAGWGAVELEDMDDSDNGADEGKLAVLSDEVEHFLSETGLRVEAITFWDFSSYFLVTDIFSAQSPAVITEDELNPSPEVAEKFKLFFEKYNLTPVDPQWYLGISVG